MYRACADVLALATQLPVAHLPSAAELRQQLTAALDKMVSRGRRARLPDADLSEARYALVALLDEQVLRASWAGRPEWMQRPLQFDLYQDNNAGEDFFVRLGALLRSADRPLAVQVYYLCLALGFRGIYEQSGDRKSLAKFANAARQQLSSSLPSAADLSPHARALRAALVARPGRAALGWALGGALLITLTVAISAWSVEHALRSAIAEIAETSPAAARISRP
jgi:type VI secretion system protein ImpK